MTALHLGPGATLGRYRILSPIARGGMGDVWLAEATGTNGFKKQLVLKTILPIYGEDPDFLAMFINEALLASGLNHPNIVQIFDLGEIEGHPFIAMEYVPGRTLRDIATAALEAGKSLPRWFVLHVLSAVCEGLQYAHDLRNERGEPLGLVHRDMTPENVMVSYAGAVKVFDFGIAKATKELLSGPGSVKGKLAYIAPEMLDGQIDRRSDVYAVGVMLYELLTGQLPCNGRTITDVAWKHKHEPAPRPRALNPSIPEDLEEVILTALDRDPTRRFAEASQVRARIDEFLVGIGGRPSAQAVGAYVASLFPREPALPAERTRRPSADEVVKSGLKLAEPSEEPPETAPVSITAESVTDPGEEATRRFDHGLRLLRQGLVEEALKEWELAASLDPKNRDYEFNLRRLRKKAAARAG